MPINSFPTYTVAKNIDTVVDAVEFPSKVFPDLLISQQSFNINFVGTQGDPKNPTFVDYTNFDILEFYGKPANTTVGAAVLLATGTKPNGGADGQINFTVEADLIPDEWSAYNKSVNDQPIVVWIRLRDTANNLSYEIQRRVRVEDDDRIGSGQQFPDTVENIAFSPDTPSDWTEIGVPTNVDEALNNLAKLATTGGYDKAVYGGRISNQGFTDWASFETYWGGLGNPESTIWYAVRIDGIDYLTLVEEIPAVSFTRLITKRTEAGDCLFSLIETEEGHNYYNGTDWESRGSGGGGDTSALDEAVFGNFYGVKSKNCLSVISDTQVDISANEIIFDGVDPIATPATSITAGMLTFPFDSIVARIYYCLDTYNYTADGGELITPNIASGVDLVIKYGTGADIGSFRKLAEQDKAIQLGTVIFGDLNAIVGVLDTAFKWGDGSFDNFRTQKDEYVSGGELVEGTGRDWFIRSAVCTDSFVNRVTTPDLPNDVYLVQSDGVGGYTTGDVTDYQPSDTYDDLSGALQSLGVNNYNYDTVWRSAGGVIIVIKGKYNYSQSEYDELSQLSLNGAEDLLYDTGIFPVGWLVYKQGEAGFEAVVSMAGASVAPSGGSGGGGVGGTDFETLNLTGNIVYSPTSTINTKTVKFIQDATGYRTVDLSAISFSPAQVSFIAEEPNAVSLMQIVKDENSNWLCVNGIEWGY